MQVDLMFEVGGKEKVAGVQLTADCCMILALKGEPESIETASRVVEELFCLGVELAEQANNENCLTALSCWVPEVMHKG